MKNSNNMFVCILYGSIGISQDYNYRIGLRAGFNQGLTCKAFYRNKVGSEGILATRWRDLR